MLAEKLSNDLELEDLHPSELRKKFDAALEAKAGPDLGQEFCRRCIHVAILQTEAAFALQETEASADWAGAHSDMYYGLANDHLHS